MSELLLRLRASSGRPFDVLGVGECSHDLVLTLPPGEALSRPLPDKLRASSLEALGGGQIATALVAARRLGRAAAFCGAVGDDASGREVLAGLAAEGVDLRAVRICAGASTRTAVLLVDEAGERAVLEVRHPGLVIDEGSPPEALVAAARVLHVDGTFPMASLAAARLARRYGTLVSVDLDRPFPGVDELLELADLCAVSERFPQLLLGEPDADRAALRLAERAPGAGLIVVTRGERGCAVISSGSPGPSASAAPPMTLLPAFTPPVLRDTTGCGDTFRAALIVALLERAETQLPQGLLHAVSFAQAAAALKCGAPGRRGCPTLEQVHGFLRSH